MPPFVVPIIIIVAVLAIFFVSGYLKAPPDTAYIPIRAVMRVPMISTMLTSIISIAGLSTKI